MLTFVLINESIALSLSLLFNLTLLVFLNRYTPSHLKSYARMLYIHCLSDLLFELINVLASVSPTPIDGTVFLVLTGFLKTNVHLSSYLIRSYLCSVLYSISLPAIDFWYRYCTVCLDKQLSNVQLGSLVFVGFATSFCVSFIHSRLYVQFGPSNETRILEEKLRFHLQWQDATFSAFEPSNPYAIQCMIFLIMLVVFAYAIMFFTIYKINSKVKSGISKRLRIGHRQVSQILFIQSTVPLVLCIPSALVCLCALLAIDLPTIGPLILSVTVWLGVAKPLVTICIVPAFRRRLFILTNRLSSDDS